MIRPLAARAATTGRPLVRHLALHFPEDARALEVEDQYLLGPDLLVAPVLDPGVHERTVYLPAGDWILIWDRSRWAGGREHVVPAPLGEPPVFVARPVDEVLGMGWRRTVEAGAAD